MRLKQSRLKQYHHKKRITVKDSEGGTSEEYGAAVTFSGEIWPAGGKVQAEMYGERLQYIYNVRLDGNYSIQPDEKGHLHYIHESGADMMESDGICLFSKKDAIPDYKIIAIRPYRFLKLEVEKL